MGVSPANWLLLMELDGMVEGGTGILPVKRCTWGLDSAGLSGAAGFSPRGFAGYGAPALQGVGGTLDNPLGRQGQVAGLLAMEDMQDPNDPNDNLNYVYMYDANGNVTQVVDWSRDSNDPAGAIVANCEYAPFGNLTARSGPYADDNPFRWSTKYVDAETGLSYFGYRYYSPGRGRSTFGSRAQLLHQPERIHDHAPLGQNVVADHIDHHAPNLDAPAGGRDAQERTAGREPERRRWPWCALAT